MPLDQTIIRTQHTLQVLRLLWQADYARVDLSREVELSRSAVSSITAELLEAGMISEVGPRDSVSTGRRATLLSLRRDAAHLLTIDLGASHLRVDILDLKGQSLASTHVQHDIQHGPQASYDLISQQVALTLQRVGLTWRHLTLAGVGIPGPVDQSTGCVVKPPNMPGWHGQNVRAALEARLGVGVRVENDANLGALAETRFGPHQGVTDLIYVKAATGIGAGILLGGHLLRGMRGGAGELGHISINEQGPLGRSGNPGSLESYATAPVLERLAEQLRQGGHPTTLNAQPTTAQLLSVANTDPLARAVWEEGGHHLGVAISTALNLFNPATVVIGGRLAQAGEVYLNAIRESALRRTLAINAERTSIELSTLGRDAATLGAAALLLDELFTPEGLPLLYRTASNAPPNAHRSDSDPVGSGTTTSKPLRPPIFSPGGTL